MKNYYSLPVLTQAVLFEYGNWEEIIQVIKINGVSAKGVYLNKDGNVAPEGTFTEYRGILIATGRPGEVLIARIGDYIIKSEDETSVEFFPVDAETFKLMYVEDTRLIGNGQHTFGQLYDQLVKYDESLRTASSIMDKTFNLLDRLSPFIDNPAIKIEMEELTALIGVAMQKPEPESPLKIVK